MYAFAPNGELLSYEVLVKNYDDAMTRPAPIRAMMQRAIQAYAGLPADDRQRPHPAAADLDHEDGQVNAYDARRPDDGLILRVTARDLPRDGTFDPYLWSADGRWEPRSAFNIDYAWFRADEARAFLPDTLEAGVTREVDPDLVARLAQFHLLNNIRCHTAVPHERGDVTRALLRSTIESVDANRVTLRFAGEAAAAHAARTEWERGWHGTDPIGFEGRLMGRAVWDTDAQRFVSFELVALGERFGSDATRAGEPRTPLGFALKLAPDTPTDHAPPAALQYGYADRYWGD